MDAQAQLASRGEEDARQARAGALWAGAVTIGAIVWVMSGLPQGGAPDALPQAGAKPQEPEQQAAASPAMLAPIQPVTLKASMAAPVVPAPAPAAERTALPARVPSAAPTPAASTPASRPAPRRHLARLKAGAPARAARPRPAPVRPSDDSRIRMQVAERLTANPSISGRIGIDSRGAVVHLTGYTMTIEQARRAEREARGVRGVRGVRNEIRPRIGGTR